MTKQNTKPDAFREACDIIDWLIDNPGEQVKITDMIAKIQRLRMSIRYERGETR